MIIQRAEYACFAHFVYAATTYAIGTVDAYRGGVQYLAGLRNDAQISRRFERGALAGVRGFDLVISDATLGSWQSLVAGNNLDGTAVTVACECTVTFADGSTSTNTVTEVLNVQGTALAPGKVTITLVDREHSKLGTLYPAELWTAKVYRDIAQADTGVAVAYPIGTCRKVKAALLCADTTTSHWFYGVCSAPLLTLAIAGINTGAQRFLVAGDYTDRISAGTVIYIDLNATSSNRGRYTVASTTFDGTNTRIVTVEAIASATVSGNVLVPPTVLAVYRDGRLVPTTEYTVEMTYPVLTQCDDSDFDGSPGLSWTLGGGGTGSATITTGVLRLVGDGGAVNYGTASPTASVAEMQVDAYYVATLTLATAGRVRLDDASGVPGGAVMSGIGTHTALVKQEGSSGFRKIRISTESTGYSGTVDVDNLELSTRTPVLMIRFVREQVGHDGNLQTIQADVRGTGSRNVADEISRLLTAAGVTPDASTFATAQTYATTHRMLVDCDHGALVSGDGGSTGQRRIDAIINDLLPIARGSLYRTSAGAYALLQEKASSSVATLSEDDGDLIECKSHRRPPMPASVSLSYLPNLVDPQRTTHTITRTVASGVLGAANPETMRYLSDHEAADRLLCYRALRAEQNREVRFVQYLGARVVGEVVTLVSPAVGIYSATEFWIQDTQQVPGGVECTGLGYQSSIHTYSAQAFPADASATYQPDYSKTAPATPTALTITARSTALATDGATVARISVTAVAPAVNFAELWFWAVHNTTNEITGLFRGELSGGSYGGVLTGLRPGEVYQLKCDAVNSFGIHSGVPANFNATAIGGGATDTTFTAAGYATAPATVSSCTATQHMGRNVRINWAGVSTANLARYALEKKIAAGAFTEIARLEATELVDTNVAIGVAYQYRVRAVDRYGNLSASYATSGSITLASTVGGGAGGDIGASSVDTSNRSAASGVGITYNATDVLAMSSGGVVGKAVAHGLGKLPIVGACVYGGSGVLSLTPRDPDSTNITIVAFGHPISPVDSASGPGAHQHTISFSTVADGDTATIYVW